MRMSLKKAY